MKSLLTLPSDIVKEIADYTGIVKIRNGKYMTQIAKTDPRYDILKTIPQKKIFPKTPMRNFISTVILSGGFSFQCSHCIYLDVSGISYNGEDYIDYSVYVINYSDKNRRRNYYYCEGYIHNPDLPKNILTRLPFL